MSQSTFFETKIETGEDFEDDSGSQDQTDSKEEGGGGGGGGGRERKETWHWLSGASKNVSVPAAI